VPTIILIEINENNKDYCNSIHKDESISILKKTLLSIFLLQGAGMSLAQPGRKQANVSVRME